MKKNLRKNMRIMWPLLVMILISGGFVVNMNYRYNNEDRYAELTGCTYSNDEISIRLAARGEGTDEIATWDYNGIDYDEDGNEYRIPYIGTIYELTVTNKTSGIISDWKFDVSMPEDTYLNSGWNGEFEIHQHCGTDDEAVYSTSNFDMKDCNIDYTNYQSCMLIPMNEGDWFAYTPSVKSDEMPVPASDLKKEEYSAKTIGFILYFRDKDMDYLADFRQCRVYYHMYRSLWDEKAFKAICAAFVIWILGVAEIHILYLNTKKLIRQQKRNMKIIKESMETFANFIDAKDPNTKGHSVRVAQYSKMIALKLGMSEEECQDIFYIGLLHDCGKISIPQEILMKPGRLTDEEYEVMKSHALKGYEMLENFTSIPNIGAGACSHHERYDGKGYPRGLKGEAIPLIGRIICVADAFDAMNSKRCYRDKLNSDVIIDELRKNRGIQFDPEITDLILSLIESGAIKM